MALISAQSKSSRSTITISTINLQNIIANTWLVMYLIPLISQFYLVCLLPLGLWILLVAIIWHLTRPYILNLNLHHTLLIFAQLMVPQCLVIIYIFHLNTNLLVLGIFNVLNFFYNLFSMGQLVELGYRITFNYSGCIVLDPSTWQEL